MTFTLTGADVLAEILGLLGMYSASTRSFAIWVSWSVETLARPSMFTLLTPSTVFWGASTTKVTLPEVIGASLAASSTLAVKVTFAPVTAVSNDVCKTVMEDTFAWDSAGEAPAPLSRIRPSRDSRSYRAAPGVDADPDPEGAPNTTSLPPWKTGTGSVVMTPGPTFATAPGCFPFNPYEPSCLEVRRLPADGRRSRPRPRPGP